MADEVVRLHDEYYISSTSARLEHRTRVLKHGDTFAVFDRVGNVEGFGRNEYGVFHQDTRYLSQMGLRMATPGHPPQALMLLSSAIKDDNAVLTVDMTNPSLPLATDTVIEQGSLHLLRTQVLWQAALCDRVRVHNYGETPVRIVLHLSFGADFADIFEARGMKRERRGSLRAPRIEQHGVVLAYEGLDGRLRRTRITFDPVPVQLAAHEARYELELAPHGAATLRWTVSCEAEDAAEKAAVAQRAEGLPRDAWYEEAVEWVCEEMKRERAAEPVLWTANAQFNEWIARSLADLHMLSTATPTGRYPYAGVPWFSTPFGRDGIITALQCLWFTPELARGVLAYLAATQADRESPEQDAQPGKILHETRGGEMAALGEVPFGRYYGSVDSTPLFVMLAGAYHERSGDHEFVRRLWPHIERALQWIDNHGDVDGDGFVEYARRTPRGLVNQGWKDSHDAVFHADGQLAEGPIALCEVQGYVYAAKHGAARIARALDDHERAHALEQQALELKHRFEEAFWDAGIGTYALALDGHKQPCRVRTSNAGHCLFTGIASGHHAQQVADTLMGEPGFSGWGVRTVSSVERRYNPMSYHDGSVWPHDNSIVAAGLGRFGFREQAARILSGLFDASLFFDLHRLPELFCGFARRAGENPTLYPLACSPQAWAAAAPLLCLQACLGMEIDGAHGKVTFRNPVLPEFLGQIRLHGLRLKQGSMDLVVTRHEHDVGVRLMRREGDVELVVLM